MTAAEPAATLDCTSAASLSPGTPPARVRFATEDAFHRDLREQVDRYFRLSGRRRYDLPQMYIKIATISLWVIVSYTGLVFFAANWWQMALCVFSLGLASATVGFSIQHDGGHRALSRYTWVNRWLSRALDFIGGSSYLWNYKHNVMHHTYANIEGHDDDIDVGIFGRFSPHQKKLWIHNFQHFYMWLLYGFLALKWQMLDDYVTVAKGRIGDHPFPRPKGIDLVVFIVGKVVFLSLVFGIPILLAQHSWLLVALGYVGVCLVQGFVIAVVFQLAHVVEEADFPEGIVAPDRMDWHWAEHQVLTTVDFAPRSKVISWLVGGLNFQVEHHLFPRLCHLHYPKIAPIVARVCKRHGLPYYVHDTFLSALRSHYRLLRELGRGMTATRMMPAG